MAPKIVLHHLQASRSERFCELKSVTCQHMMCTSLLTPLVWVLEELGLEYDVKVYARLPSRAAPPELKKATPFGKVRQPSSSHHLKLSVPT